MKPKPKAKAAKGFWVKDSRSGYTPATGDQLLEAAKAVALERLIDGETLNSPMAVRHYLPAIIGQYPHERFGVIYLNNQNQVIAYEELFRGTIDQAAVYPRDIAKSALDHHAASVMLVHNHPSASLEPSKADQAITKRIKDALGLLDIRVLDHVIVSKTATLSMAEKGLV